MTPATRPPGSKLCQVYAHLHCLDSVKQAACSVQAGLNHRRNEFLSTKLSAILGTNSTVISVNHACVNKGVML